MAAGPKRSSDGTSKSPVAATRARLITGVRPGLGPSANDNSVPLPIVLRRVWAGAAALVAFGALVAVAFG